MLSHRTRVRFARILVSSSVAIAALLLLFGISPGPAGAETLSGSLTADAVNGGALDGYYHYTLTVTWKTERGLTAISLGCATGGCQEAACAQSWVLPTVAGQAVSTSGCRFNLTGSFRCDGNAETGYSNPTLVWEPIAAGGCETGNEGIAVLEFYTDAPPSPGDLPITLRKDGEGVAQSTTAGVCPLACPVPAEAVTWGRIKELMGRDR